jgi:hypothetical protein
VPDVSTKHAAKAPNIATLRLCDAFGPVSNETASFWDDDSVAPVVIRCFGIYTMPALHEFDTACEHPAASILPPYAIASHVYSVRFDRNDMSERIWTKKAWGCVQMIPAT